MDIYGIVNGFFWYSCWIFMVSLLDFFGTVALALIGCTPSGTRLLAFYLVCYKGLIIKVYSSAKADLRDVVSIYSIRIRDIEDIRDNSITEDRRRQGRHLLPTYGAFLTSYLMHNKKPLSNEWKEAFLLYLKVSLHNVHSCK